MIMRAIQNVAYFLVFVPIWLFLTLARIFPFQMRSKVGGQFVSTLAFILPGMRKRIQANIKLVFPELSQAELNRLSSANSVAMGRTLTEIP